MAREASCVFCRIVAGEAPADVVLDEPRVFAFLDRRPLFPGHVLVIPREHHRTLVELPESAVAPLFLSARRIARALGQVLACDGTFVAANNGVSQSVPHLHVHVVPRRKGDGLKGFFWPRRSYASDDERVQTAARLREALAGG